MNTILDTNYILYINANAFGINGGEDWSIQLRERSYIKGLLGNSESNILESTGYYKIMSGTFLFDLNSPNLNPIDIDSLCSKYNINIGFKLSDCIKNIRRNNSINAILDER